MRLFDLLYRWRPLGLLLVLPALGACAQGIASHAPVTKAAAATAVERYEDAEGALRCIRTSGALHNVVIAVGMFADSTGKGNSVAPGSTGTFLPQGGSSVVVAEALQNAGAIVIDAYENSTEKTIRDYLGTGAPKPGSVPVQYIMNGIFTSLDFGKNGDIDLQVAGAGPIGTAGFAQITMAAQLVRATNKQIMQISRVQRTVRYTSLGATVGKVVGAELVTGGASLQNQERLEFEALNGPIATMVADTLVKQFPVAAERCGGMVANLLTASAI